MKQILIVEDQSMVKNYMMDQIKKSKKYHVAYCIDNASLAEMYCLSEKIDMIIMDVCTSHNESGLVAAKKIKKSFPDIKIIIATSMPEHSFVKKAKEANCESFWYKENNEISFMEVIDKTMNGESVYPKEDVIIEIGSATSKDFTNREYEIIKLIVEGKSYDEISTQLGISKNTLKYHIKNLLSKTGYSSIMLLAMDVINKKLVLPGY